VITYLRLNNFRRHAETELRFDPTDQIVIIAGNNGVGKSTLFEAVLWNLYGEGRNGRNRIDRLIRRGADLEGMEVELEFQLGEVSYRVKRRRDNGVSSAVLWANEVALVEGAREVSDEVSRILGMDVKGFKLATYAQQKELNGLASMQPNQRTEMLTRLLRLDVIARAEQSANAEYRHRRDIVAALGSGEDLDVLRGRAGAAQAELGANCEALEQARASIAALEAELTVSAAVDAAYNAAIEHRARLSALVQAGEEEEARLEADLAGVVVPDPLPSPPEPLMELQARTSAVEREIARGEEHKRQLAQTNVVRSELQRCEGRLDVIEASVAAIGEVDLNAATLRMQAARAALMRAEAEREELLGTYTAADERQKAAERDVSKAESLEAECSACGQSVPDDHRHRQLEAARVVLEAARTEAAELLRKGAEAKGRLVTSRLDLEAAEEGLRATRESLEELKRLHDERGEVIRRRGVYLDQLERLDGHDVDLTSLYAERAELALAVNLAGQSRERAAIRQARIERRDSLVAALETARGRLQQHRAALTASEVDTDLELAHQRRQAQLEARQTEQELIGELQAMVAGSTERARAVDEQIQRVEKDQLRRAELTRQGEIALWTAKVLDRAREHSASQIRPSLEGGVSELLNRLSDGRFDAVSLDEDYNVFVRDDGVMRPLNDLSGGEVDLVSLALRLALASVVAERHGSGGAGFLILDEPIGSQDTGRRGSILNALRGLKGSHGQIFLISHVGGLEDAADAVVEVDLDDERHAVASKS
jgi:DNA repair protein SbcC/Rad50